MRKRGRPKGADKTVIGLPRKKSRGNKPVSFLYKSAKQKELGLSVKLLIVCEPALKINNYFLFVVILTWFVDTQIAKEATDGTRIIDEEDIEMRPEMISSSCTDENVCLDMCRKYCTREAWGAIKSVVSVIRDNPTWYCGRCTLEIIDDEQCSIVCDSCLVWYHFACVGLKKSPKSRIWMCRSCYEECDEQ